MIKYIKSIKQTFDEFYNSLVLLQEKTLEHNDILRKIDSILPKNNLLWVPWVSYTTISWSINYESVTTKILDSVLIKDFFTKEFLNQDATTTKKLYVVNWDKIAIEYYKENDNTRDWERWFDFNWKEYYFLNK